jgi:monothiol glutaredoxin
MDTKQKIKEKVESNRVMLFMKGNRDFPQCGFSGRAVQILQALGAEFETADVLMDDEIRQGIKDYSNWPTIPQLYVDGEFVGGSDIMMELYQNGELKKKLEGQVST